MVIRQYLPCLKKSSMWDVKEPTHQSKKVGHEVHGVVAVLYVVAVNLRESSIVMAANKPISAV